MILIGLGANLPSRSGPPQATLKAGLAALEAQGVTIEATSRWWRSAPVPVSDQPWFINAVASVSTALSAPGLLALLHRIEAGFGRMRRRRDEARSIDLDLLAYGEEVIRGEDGLILPHPRLHERAFVLAPLCDIAPGWRHPVLGLTARALLDQLPPGQQVEHLDLG